MKNIMFICVLLPLLSGVLSAQTSATPQVAKQVTVGDSGPIDLVALGLPADLDMLMGDLSWFSDGSTRVDTETVVVCERTVLLVTYPVMDGMVGVYVDNDFFFIPTMHGNLGPFPLDALNDLPGALHPATAGATHCWSIPNIHGVHKLGVFGKGDTLAEAVAEYKKKIDDLLHAKWEIVPCE